MARSVYSGIEMQEVDASVRSIRSKELKQAAAAFNRNVDDLHALLTLPLALLNIGLWEADRMHYLADAIAKAQLRARGKQARSATSKVVTAANLSFEKGTRHPATERARSRMVDIAEKLLHNLLNNKKFDEARFAMRALFYASISSAWGAFESAARDSWIAAVNARPTLLAQGTLAKVQEAISDDRLSNKHIPVGLLARHSYDLRHVMGELLAPKFDFTGISGIRAAYSASFRGEAAIAKALANPTLGQLEATRHLIVHRAGWVDEEFQRRAKIEGALGTRLPMDGKRVSALSNAAVEAGSDLLIAIDSWLIKNRAVKRVSMPR